MTAAELSGSALAQQELWGTDPRGWAEVAEPLNQPLFTSILDATSVGAGTRVLDVGCGSGLTLVLASKRGATVAGLDVSPGLLSVATERLPDADLRLGDLQVLPFADESYDVVLGVNAFQFAADPVGALGEARRVVRPGGLVAASLFAEPERCESTAIHLAMAALSPPARQSSHQPYALSAPQGLERALTASGLDVEMATEVPVVWRYADADAAVRGLLSSGGGARAIQDVGRDAVEAAVREALVPFTTIEGHARDGGARDGGARDGEGAGVVAMHNVFRYVVARRPHTA